MELSAFISDIENGLITLVDQDVTVVNTVSLTSDQAKAIAADTTGTVTATIASTQRVSKLTELRQPNSGVDETNAFTITISGDDNTTVTAAELNTINDATSVAIDLTNVTSIGASNIADLSTMNTGIAGFSNTTGIVAIDITDGGDGSGDVDFGALDLVLSLIHI